MEKEKDPYPNPYDIYEETNDAGSRNQAEGRGDEVPAKEARPQVHKPRRRSRSRTKGRAHRRRPRPHNEKEKDHKKATQEN